MIAATLPPKSFIPNIKPEDLEDVNIEHIFDKSLKLVKSLKMYERFCQDGWTTELALQTKEILLLKSSCHHALVGTPLPSKPTISVPNPHQTAKTRKPSKTPKSPKLPKAQRIAEASKRTKIRKALKTYKIPGKPTTVRSRQNSKNYRPPHHLWEIRGQRLRSPGSALTHPMAPAKTSRFQYAPTILYRLGRRC